MSFQQMEVSREDWEMVEKQAENLLRQAMIDTEINDAIVRYAKEKKKNAPIRTDKGNAAVGKNVGK